ncbi:uncharacterized protein LOC129611744 [Condylostylus longicornis]|uniref:uncharacterized protein LOC129611744 n=1 Tax=Condylostylus longicornis TaxID=2530218 RepID=UPI00244D9BF1|nr:uncharacterized protein LOC129611744 [Condylostylus longicornis]
MPIGMDSMLANLIKRKPLRKPVIKLSCGIGDSDGFPAFDSEQSEVYGAPEDSKWGFNITGGSEFHMPLTVFQVSPHSLAAYEGIKLGDIILSINEIDASQMSLAQAREIIDSGYKLFIVLRSMEDEDVPIEERKPAEEKSISMRVPEPMKPPEPPKGKLSRAVIEEKLRSMQRKLSEIAEIPKILSSTLETVSQTFEKFVPDIENDVSAYENDINELDVVNNEKFNLDYHFKPIDEDNNSSEKESGTQDDLSNPDILLNENNDGQNNNDDDEDEFFEADSLDGDLQKNFINRIIDDSPESDYISNSEGDGDEEYCSPIEITSNTKPVSIMTILNPGKCMPELKTEEEQAEDDEQVEDDSNVKTKIVEDPLKKEKNEKIDKLEKSWPWADRQKIIYRESTCHLVPRLSIVESRIKQLGGTSTLQFYERKRQNINKSE